MYCRNCGKEVAQEAVMCISCGVPPRNGKMFCQNCGAQTNPAAEICTKCGVRLSQSVSEQSQKSKMAAGLLGIFLGGLGIHRFYLGYTAIGVAQLILSLLGIVTCGITTIASWIWGLVEGIMILTGSIGKDAKGIPLKD
jgi:TM2 domain-containing membrane protein YozV/ribosomal protein L40E